MTVNSFSSFLGLSQGLPVTSYTKMIDIWMLFTMTVPFLEVVYHTTNEIFKESLMNRVVGPANLVGLVRVKSANERDIDEDEVINKRRCTWFRTTGHLMLPICSTIFIFTFWTVGIIASYSSDASLESNMTAKDIF